jgi:Undecaprenyl-phosphate glucose phosphotransferase
MFYYTFFLYRKLGYNFRNVIIVGYSQQSQELAKYFSHTKWNGYKFLGFIDNQIDKKRRIVAQFSDLRSFIENQQVDEIYLNLFNIPKDLRPKISEIVMDFPVKIRIIPDFGEFANFKAELVNYDFVPVLQVHPGPLSYWYNQLMKRLFDIVFSLFIIVTFLSWFSGILFILSLFNGREGVFFKQKRTGTDGEIFTCLKYRTMHSNPDADKVQAIKNDKRVMPVGRLLRKTGLDELPQFINVLLGQMSVVGPRPHMLRHTEQYKKMVRKYMMRHTVKPGITGLAQVRGFRGEIRKISELKQRVQLDVSYIENWSFMLDVRIVFLTVVNFFRGQEKAY